eukprot:SAG25_NODE_171_length_13027_cov_80.469833_3_plen_67_part_00
MLSYLLQVRRAPLFHGAATVVPTHDDDDDDDDEWPSVPSVRSPPRPPTPNGTGGNRTHGFRTHSSQ